MCTKPVKKQAPNHNRKRIIENGYLALKDKLPISERNKEIITEYVTGRSYIEIGKDYNLTSARISMIVSNYVRHAIKYLNENSEID